MSRSRLLCLLLIAAACASAEDVDEDLPGIEVDEVLWMLDWFDPRHHPTWEITTPEGHLVLVEDGWVVSDSASLVPCDEETTGGHGDLVDPSATTAAIVEPVVNVYPRVFESLSFAPQRYCSVHFAFGPAYEGLDGVDAADIGLSMRVQGTFFPASGDPSEDFDLTATDATEVVLPIEPIELDEPAAVEVRIVRHFERAFDGVDPREGDVGLEVLRNLANTAELEVRELEPDNE